MRILVDTNILARISQPEHPSHGIASRAITTLANAEHELCIVPQVLFEYWAVATRPESQNRLSLPILRVAAELNAIRSNFRLVHDVPHILDYWMHLVATHSVLGKSSHDARLVAAMLAHGIEGILTLNPADFERYNNIRIFDPAVVSGT